MTRALVELRKSLDELCGATARAGWIVDTWNAYQSGRFDSSAQTELGLGSAAINGVEMSNEGEMTNGVQAPIGRPSMAKGKTSGGEIDSHPITNGAYAPAMPMTIRPPPGLAFSAMNAITADSVLMDKPMVYGSKHFPPGRTVIPEPLLTNGTKSASIAGRDKIHLLRRVAPAK
jgi:hypothetical protein